jgi:hypothetical protein
MYAHTAVAVNPRSFFIGTLLFARQPEPDLEFTEEDLADAAPQSAPPAKSPKPSNKRPILWLLLLALLGGLAYVAMDPDMVMQVIEPYLGDQEAPEAGSDPSRRTTATAPTAPDPPPTPQPETGPSGSALPPTQADPGSASSATPPGPLFAEGQKVSVVPDVANPDRPVVLFADAARTRPGPTVAPGSSLTVLDGELQRSGWIYSVSTGDGRHGWVAEKHLKFRR